MIQLPTTNRDWFMWMAFQFIGHWYKWGGDDPVGGFDCSGLVIECGKVAGIYPRQFDDTAQGIYGRLYNAGKSMKDSNDCPGSLVFWGKDNDPDSIYHVEICLGGGRSIGASGGNSTTTTIEQAIKQNAFVKIRPIAGRPGVMFFADPFFGDPL